MFPERTVTLQIEVKSHDGGPHLDVCYAQRSGPTHLENINFCDMSRKIFHNYSVGAFTIPLMISLPPLVRGERLAQQRTSG